MNVAKKAVPHIIPSLHTISKEQFCYAIKTNKSAKSEPYSCHFLITKRKSAPILMGLVLPSLVAIWIFAEQNIAGEKFR
jgi:hypothetical protein